MARPKRIKKKKSFMFTSRHYSALGVVAFLLALCTVAAIVVSVVISFSAHGEAGINLGGVGFFSVLANITGAILSVSASKERDIYKWVPKTAFIIHLTCIVVWGAFVLLGQFH